MILWNVLERMRPRGGYSRETIKRETPDEVPQPPKPLLRYLIRMPQQPCAIYLRSLQRRA
jgi:hypothetical protein